MIKFDKVCKWFGNRQVLKEISFEVEKGETFFIVGLSGAGKSVTLKHMIKLLKPTSGAIHIDGDCLSSAEREELATLRSRFGYLFQSSALLQWLTVGENVALPLREHSSLSDQEINDRVVDVLTKVSLKDAMKMYPTGISGGMAKRVGLARAIVTQPEIILYDEPTSGLDPVTSRAIDELIDSLRVQLDVTSVVVTHDMISALTIGSRIAMLHLGKLIEVSPPREFLHSKNEIVRKFLNSQMIDEDILDRKGAML